MKRQSSPPQYVKAIGEHAASARHVTSTQAMPDDRLLLTLDDGRSFVIDAERLTPQADGTYHVKLNATTDNATFAFVRNDVATG